MHELVYGVARLQGRLDHLLARHVRRGLGGLDPEVHVALRLGAYEALYMGGVPAYAAVSQAVSLARAVSGRGASGLVNAVLRAVAEDGDDLRHFPDPASDPAGFLATWGSHPRWMVDRWLGRWAFGEVRRLVEIDNRRPSLNLVPLEHTVDEAVSLLAAAGIDARRVGGGTACLLLPPGTDPAAALDVLPSVIQDPGANLVVRYADIPPGMNVADLCTAPGGKALVLSGRTSHILAADRSEVRMRLVRENARRTGRRLHLVVADAARPPLREAQAVLLDVPCTGTGTLARHPDGRWRLNPGSVDAMARIQRALLDRAAELVVPGGFLIYSTCSLEAEENDMQVAAFLERRPSFRLESSDAVPSEHLDGAGQLQVLPWRTDFDGAYAARLRRVA